MLSAYFYNFRKEVVEMFPFGAVVSACSMMRRNNEDNKKKDNISMIPTSTIKLSIDKNDIRMNFSIENEDDWARAAWVLINVCKEKGQMENLNHMLNTCDANIKAGSLDMPEKLEE